MDDEDSILVENSIYDIPKVCAGGGGGGGLVLL